MERQHLLGCINRFCKFALILYKWKHWPDGGTRDAASRVIKNTRIHHLMASNLSTLEMQQVAVEIFWFRASVGQKNRPNNPQLCPNTG